MERRALLRQYRETPRPAGVWCVRNLQSGHALVGASPDAPAALNRERAQLRFGAHRNAALQRDWQALGPDAFAFEVLDRLTPPEGGGEWDPRDDLRVLEALWLDRLQPFAPDGGYTPRPR